MRTILTGATGFIGSRLLSQWKKTNSEVVPVSFSTESISQIDFVDVSTVIHLAGIVHQMDGGNEQEFRDINHHKTVHLAEKAKKSGASHFVFMSTVKVYGIDSSTEIVSIDHPCRPDDPYGTSKWEAEKDLMTLADKSFRVAIIRTPLVYGPGVKGNLLRLMQLIDRYAVIPLGGIKNQRSMIYVDNLIAYLDSIIENGSSGVFLVSDLRPYSTTELVLSIASEMGRKPYVITLPHSINKIVRILKPDVFQRLFASLVFDSKGSNQKLNFSPPNGLDDGIREMVKDYRNA